METKLPGRAPDFASRDGVSIWVNLDKNNNKYLSVKILGAITVNCFKVEPRPQEPVEPPQPETFNI